ncbi:zinc ribbon domain-containing protein [candidate division WOR-3 bacterium]|uniref:Zinc ribbon domain-containing protein n=1 Tax=candidate division WOR-3 bacterium TaxID=2052148 RepID=A0A9D5K9P9_UNCW3|nr:zinc ribbon domain-containing protein [candidate division WOR-3 bacterium]MBD3364981.1 zinc ribbon domain-containing protein [candidate division WOR-3 bacterium]
MPIREFRCRKCGNVFEFLVLKDSDKKGLRCPSCKAKDLEVMLSVFGVAGAGKKSDSSSGGGCGTCSSGNCSICGL